MFRYNTSWELWLPYSPPTCWICQMIWSCLSSLRSKSSTPSSCRSNIWGHQRDGAATVPRHTWSSSEGAHWANGCRVEAAFFVQLSMANGLISKHSETKQLRPSLWCAQQARRGEGPNGILLHCVMWLFCSFGTQPGLRPNFWGKAACQHSLRLPFSLLGLSHSHTFNCSTFPPNYPN